MTGWRGWLALGLLVGLAPTGWAADRPNVVLIVADDQGWTDFGFMGHEVIKTPHLDQLAAESAVFPNGYVPTSLCRASLATLLTGQYAHQHKICCNDPPDGVDRAAMHPFIKNAPALPAPAAGGGLPSASRPASSGRGTTRNGGFTDGMTTKGRHGDDGLVIGRKTMKPIYDFIDDAQGQAVLRLVRPDDAARAAQPAGAAPEEVRSDGPADQAREVLGDVRVVRRDRRRAAGVPRRRRSCATTRSWCSSSTTAGSRRRARTQTTRGWFAPKSKLSPYDGGLRTPVLLRWPGQTKPGEYDDLVSTIDLAPTILTACGVKAPPAMPGLSLLDAAAGKGAAEPRRGLRRDLSCTPPSTWTSRR